MFKIFKRKRFPWGKLLFFVGLVSGIAAISIIAYKYIEGKYRELVLGMIDLDEDGKSDAVMLDTSGNGEVDTIVLGVETD